VWSCKATSGDTLFLRASAAVRNRSTTSSEVLAERGGEEIERRGFLLRVLFCAGLTGSTVTVPSWPESVMVLSLAEVSDSEPLPVLSDSAATVGEALREVFLFVSMGGGLRD